MDLGSKMVNKSIRLYGGRSGQRVRSLRGPSNSVVRGGGERIFVTDEEGRVMLDITKERTKVVAPGRGFDTKRLPTPEELEVLRQFI